MFILNCSQLPDGVSWKMVEKYYGEGVLYDDAINFVLPDAYDEAIEMYTIRDRDDYTIALYKKLTELGIDWE